MNIIVCDIKSRTQQVVAYLKDKGKEGIEVSISPRSRSTYITYSYDGLLRNYIEIRISDHKLKKNNSQINIIL